MKRMCRACGKGELVSGRERVHYTESGLPNVWLENVEVRRCPVCKEHVVVLFAVEHLHRAIALAVAKKSSRLTGVEARFLRKVLGFSGVDFARHLGVDPTILSKWENGALPIGEQSDRLLRLMVVHGRPVEEYPLETLADIDSNSRESAKISLRVSGREWQAVA